MPRSVGFVSSMEDREANVVGDGGVTADGARLVDEDGSGAELRGRLSDLGKLLEEQKALISK